ncbi:MAG: hypothetical protein ABI707_09765 [Ferruginibacter sp.]
MKNDKAAMPQSKKKQTVSGSNAIGNSAKKSKSGVVAGSDSTPNPIQKTRARAGRGLANEGTIVSYNEER